MIRNFELQADGHRLEARWLGPGPADAPTLVFLHEGLGCLALWKDFPQRMVEATGCGALVYSRAGYGRSDAVTLPRPLTYMHHEAQAVLPAVLDAAGVQQAILVGHSDGGSIALINAGSVPDPRVQALILMAPHVFNEPICVAAIEQARAAYLEGGLRDGLARHHHNNVDNAFWGWNDAWLDPGFLDWNLEVFLPGVAIPTLLLQGGQDAYGTAAQIEAIEAQVAGPVESVWPDPCGHAAYRDQPETVIAASCGFLRRHGLLAVEADS
ncbi:alpha/beta fold hydrolase [Salinisphaera aquimarina]|uniref:Alpha/beta fold hydrolase n=1 Tax=Salinisphaera aquimarina TaxID=2094031 RepID=A0ABV7EPK6_9GAMM